ncbi:MAG: SLC13 family permease [Candidatus Bathyarchaeia archaeon]
MSLPDPKPLVALGIFAATYAVLAFRNVKGWKFPIWLILLIGAAAMVVSGSISVTDAYKAVDLHVLLFLFSMFTLVTALDIAGVLDTFTTWLLLKAKKPEDVLYLTFFGFAAASAVLMNDTLALMGTPVMISLAKKMKIPSRPLLLTLAFAVTIGSVVTPMGNPQNLLVALASGMRAPVLTFAKYLLIPTIINLILTYYLLRHLLRHEFARARKGFRDLIDFEAAVQKDVLKDGRFAKLSISITTLTIAAIFLVNFLEEVGVGTPFGIAEVSLFGAVLLLAFCGRSREVIQSIDWGILVLFASLFVLTQAVWDNGIIAAMAGYLPAISVGSPHSTIAAILVSSVLLSQVLSNVPMVALYIPLMKSLSFGSQSIYAWIALGAGSTLAGNLTLLGAVSTLIIVEEAEKQGQTVRFFDFLKIGIPITVVTVTVLYFFLILVA